MLRIETEPDGPRTILHLIGRIRSDCIDQLTSQIEISSGPVVLDLAEVDIVDATVVRFLCDCQDQAIELRNSSPYILEWISRERAERNKR